jgi:hypothetical protein
MIDSVVSFTCNKMKGSWHRMLELPIEYFRGQKPVALDFRAVNYYPVSDCFIWTVLKSFHGTVHCEHSTVVLFRGRCSNLKLYLCCWNQLKRGVWNRTRQNKFVSGKSDVSRGYVWHITFRIKTWQKHEFSSQQHSKARKLQANLRILDLEDRLLPYEQLRFPTHVRVCSEEVTCGTVACFQCAAYRRRSIFTNFLFSLPSAVRINITTSVYMVYFSILIQNISH